MMSKHPLLAFNKQRQEFKYLATLFPDNIVENAPYVDALNCYCLNSPANLVDFLHSNNLFSTIAKQLEEGLTKTYPTDMFIEKFKKLVDSQVPNELKALTFDNNGLEEYGSSKVFMFTDKSEEHSKTSSQVAIVVPIYSKDAHDFNVWLNRNLEKLYVYGYMLTSIEKLEHTRSSDIDLLIIQFEAKYPLSKFKLADVLLHVAPYRYLKKIQRNGLVPKSKSSEFEYGDRVYLFNQCKEALAIEYGKYKAKSIGDNGFCVFKIQRSRLESDANYRNGNMRFYVDSSFEIDNGVQAIFTYSNIPLYLLDDVCLIYDGPKFGKPRIVQFK